MHLTINGEKVKSYKVKSYKVYHTDGSLVFTIICSARHSVQELNRLFQNGMKVTVIDERSELVKPPVDC